MNHDNPLDPPFLRGKILSRPEKEAVGGGKIFAATP
jgi:hypothetical protein